MPSLRESLGLSPLSTRLKQAWIAVRGAKDVPPSRFDLSSLKGLRPRLAITHWRGKFHKPRCAVIINLFNHDQTPAEAGWSVRRTQMRDFRGKKLTYDSHNGTDFSIPRGSITVAPAAGKVVRIFSEFNRGGLKVVVDHGDGLVSSSSHLARALVREGDLVEVGQPLALTGYSGIDAVITFPFGPPHTHFNVWFNGDAVDPFDVEGTSLWIGGQPTPVPTKSAELASPPFDASDIYDPTIVDDAIAACVTPEVRDRLAAVTPLAARAVHLISERNYYPTRFPDKRSVYKRRYAPSQRLYLPFSAADFDGVAFQDELEAS